MSQRHENDREREKEEGLFSSPPTLSTRVSYSHDGFDPGKEDLLPLPPKEDSRAISKSKSETKLHNGSDKDASASTGKRRKKESLKVQKSNYREEKKRAAKELRSTITDPSVSVMADWLKIRSTLKGWTKLWCVLKPGLLLIYKTHKHGQWVGTVLLNACKLMERPSKKDGFCFTLFHPLEQSIWAIKGPKGEGVGSITKPLPSSHLIIRATSESDGRCWMDALELALKCSSLLKKAMIHEGKEDVSGEHSNFNSFLRAHNVQGIQFNDSDRFKEPDLYSEKSDHEGEQDHEDSDPGGLENEESDSDTSGEGQDDSHVDPDTNVEVLTETSYLAQWHKELREESHTETVSEEYKSLIWSLARTLLKQVRLGMDLSKILLPTFILEPRSFLDKLADLYCHADFLSEAAVEENAYNRMKKVVKWYVSGFYKKPKWVKKPYNPIIGEMYRCMWLHQKTNSKTFYIAEQVSHHPPVSAFYVSNRKDGFCLSGSTLVKSKFYGNSVSVVMEGESRLTFLNQGEDYVMNMPYVHCKGILYGTLTLELGGLVTITCEKTGYSAQLEYKLKPLLGSNDSVNQIAGKIKLGKEVLATLEGHWDGEIFINDKKTGVRDLFFNNTPELKKSRLTRGLVPLEEQSEVESERLWQHVTRAINSKDQAEATTKKCILEEAQRNIKADEWTPVLFKQDPITRRWLYLYADMRPWDSLNDVIQFEKDGWIQTQVKHRTPMVRSGSVMSVSNQGRQSRGSFKCQVIAPNRKHNQSAKPNSTESVDSQDSSGSEQHEGKHNIRLRRKRTNLSEIQRTIESIKQTQEDINRSIGMLNTVSPVGGSFLHHHDYIVIAFLTLLQVIIGFIFK